jgi:hypothetical protein
MKHTLLIFITVLLAACQGTLDRAYPDKEESPFVAIPVNSKLILHEPAEVPAHLGRVFIQNGEFRPQRLVDAYYANCAFEVRTLRETNQTILPDTFVITRVRRFGNWTSTFKTMPAGFYLLGDGPSPENWSTLLDLKSEKQPDVFRMTCQHWEDPTDARHLTIRQIRQALGKIVTLQLAPGTLSFMHAPH